MINALFRLKGLFGFKVNCRVEMYTTGWLPAERGDHLSKYLKKHYKTDDVIIFDGADKVKIEVTYY